MAKLYKKEGRRYIPVSEYGEEWMRSFPYGATLVVCREGMQSQLFNIDPAIAPMLAAAKYADTAMVEAVVEASKAHPPKDPVTPTQQKAWKKLEKAYGGGIFYVSYPSAYNIMNAAVLELSKEAEKMLQNEAVRKAYDDFMLIYKLTKEQVHD